MKRVIATLVMVLMAAIFIFVHRGKINELDRKVDESYSIIMTAAAEDDSEILKEQIKELQNAWNDVQNWVGMTIDAEVTEEIEISLSQCEQYAQIGAKEDFVGEFVLFSHMIKHLPYFENLSVESLL
ncbi:MAG: DUF4363 family protein [Clostridiales bacterium]|nr:DUF4363 family protein [Clostridiales bacterium]